MAIDTKAFFAESKRLQKMLGCTPEQADMLVAEKFWDGKVDENMKPVKGKPVSRRPGSQS